MTTRYKRSPYCLLHWDGPDLYIRQCQRDRMFRGAERYLPVLHQLSDWITTEALAAALAVDTDALQRTLDRLVNMDLVLTHAEGTEREPAPSTSWNLIDLALQRQTGRGGADSSKWQAKVTPPALKPLPPSEPIALPEQPLEEDMRLGDVLARRQTIRRYSPDPLTLSMLGGVLQAAARVTCGRAPDGTERRRRPYPSGGGRYPLELYPVVNAVEGLEPGAYYYDPRRHALHAVRVADEHQSALNNQVAVAAAGALNRDPPLVLLVTAVFERTIAKYEQLALTLILKEVGCLFQTLYLVATALGLAPCAMGGGSEADNARWLGLDPFDESQVGCFLLGRPETAGT